MTTIGISTASRLLLTLSVVACLCATLTTAEDSVNGDISWHDASDFDQCVCWDRATDSWCGNSTNFWRDSCQRYVTKTALWTIPAAILLVSLFMFPFIFFPARVCCHCCGGTKPSYGCCCPSTAPEVLAEINAPLNPEYVASMATRRYSNRTVFVTKALFMACFAAYIYFTIGVYTTSAWVNSDTGDVLDDVIVTSGLLVADLNTTVTALGPLGTLSGVTDPMSNAVLTSSLTSYQSTHASLVSETNRIRRYENAPWGRNQLTSNLISVPSGIFLMGFILCLCNIRGTPVSLLVGLMSLAAAAVTAVFMFHMVVAQLSVAVCENFNSTMVPNLVAAAQSRNACGDPATELAINSTAHAYATAMCSAGLASLCANYFTCPMAVCGADQSVRDIGNSLTYGSVNVAAINTTVTSAQPSAPLCSGGCPSVTSIAGCAATTACHANAEAVATMQYFTMLSEVGTLNQMLFATVNCNALTYNLQTSLSGDLCGSFKRNYTSLAIVTLACMLVATIAVGALIMGAKRFQKMELKPENTASVQNFVYGVLIETPEERAAVGSPMQSPAAARGYPTALPAEYGSVQQEPIGYTTKTLQ